MKLGSENRGLSVMGSWAKTSRAAPATFPLRRASHRSASFTMPPRAQLTIRTPSFICAMVAAQMRFFVSGVRGVWIVMKSDWRYRSGNSTSSTPRDWAASALLKGS
jgi:hypothetical protein